MLSKNAFYRKLFNNLKGKVILAEPLKHHTSWRIGGPAEVMVEPSDPEDLLLALQLTKKAGLPLFILGNGTNILVSDKGVSGVVIKIGRGLNYKKIKGNMIYSGAGVPLTSLARAAAEKGLGGLEFAAGIPGTLGGAIVMNAGANGSCIGDITKSVRVVLSGGEVYQKEREDLRFGYRFSSIQDSGEIVIDAVLECYSRNPEAIKQDMSVYLAGRKKSQPQGYPNAGSVFKNPEGHSAGKLIEACGCKGMKKGGAQVSLKHANFIVNLGSATAEDVLWLVEQVKEKVRRTFEIELETEFKMWGDNF